MTNTDCNLTTMIKKPAVLLVFIVGASQASAQSATHPRGGFHPLAADIRELLALRDPALILKANGYAP